MSAICVKRQSGILLIAANAFVCAAMLLMPAPAIAQGRGGGGGGSGFGLGGLGRPDGVDQKDALKDFHHAMAVQATGQQMAEFRALVKSAEAAKAILRQFQENKGQEQGKEAGESARRDAGTASTSGQAIDLALEKVRADSKRFVEGFSEAQKSGLKEISRRFDKADSDLEQGQRNLDQSLQQPDPPGAEISARADTLDKALTDFQNQQLALGREMGIMLANGQDLTFRLPAVKSTASIAGQAVAVTVAGALAQISAEGGQRTFKLDLLTDLSELQEQMTELLRAQLDKPEGCGERVAIRQAMFTPSDPSRLAVQLHYERWACLRASGHLEASELAESDGSVEIKLTPSVDSSAGLKLTAEFARINGNGMMADALRSGDLGDDLRDRVARSVLAAMRAGADFKMVLPPAVRNDATIESARFQADGAGQLRAVLEGKVRISNDQADALASQLNQPLSAQGSAPQ